MNYIGIDPGASGGIAIWDGKEVSASKCPKNPDDMYALLEIYASKGNTEQTRVFLEKVWSFPSDSHKTAFSFGRNYGMWLAALEISSVKYKLVTPKKWQSDRGFRFKALSKKERKALIKTYSQDFVDRTDKPINVTYYTADTIAIALSIENLWKELEYEVWE